MLTTGYGRFTSTFFVSCDVSKRGRTERRIFLARSGGSPNSVSGDGGRKGLLTSKRIRTPSSGLQDACSIVDG